MKSLRTEPLRTKLRRTVKAQACDLKVPGRRLQSAEVPGPNVDRRLNKEQAVCFGSFRLLMGQRLLLEGNTPVRLGSRALEILIALVERAGEVVSKEELTARVWPNTFVEPANLTVHVSALRRVLGDGHDSNRFLINIPGRGYCFVAPINLSKEFERDPAPPPGAEHPYNISANINQLIDRAGIANDRRIIIEGIDGPQEVPKTLAMVPSQQRGMAKTGRVNALDIGLEFANGARMKISGQVAAQMIWTMVTALMAKVATSAVSVQLARSSSNEKTLQARLPPGRGDRRWHDLRLKKFHR